MIDLKEYIDYFSRLGLVNEFNRKRIEDRIKKLNINISEEDLGYGGFTAYNKQNDQIDITVSEGCLKREALELNREYKEYFDENICHELIHALGLTETEVEEFFKDKKEKADFDFDVQMVSRGFEAVCEIIAQTVAQSFISLKYKKEYPEVHNTFVYDQHGNSNSSYSYDYDSKLQFYGEIENFVLDFVYDISNKKDISEIYESYFLGNVFDFELNNKIVEKLSALGMIICCDYYQQGYYGDVVYNMFTVESFKDSVRTISNNSNLLP